MIGEVEQYIPLSDDLKNARRVIEVRQVNARVGFKLQRLAPGIRERQKILGVMVSATRDHAVVAAKAKTFSQGIQQRLRHGFVINKPHGIGSTPLLETRGHLLDQALIDGRIEFQFRVSGEFEAVGGD